MTLKARASRSLAGRVTVIFGVVAIVAISLVLALQYYLASPWLAAGGALFITVPLAAWLAGRAVAGWSQSIRAVTDGISSLKDHDFSISVTAVASDEIGDLTTEYNTLGDRLRRDRLDLHQRELLLDTVVQTTPLALVLTNPDDVIIFANIAGRQLFHKGHKLEGMTFGTLLEHAPQPLREAVERGTDTLFTIDQGADADIYHLTARKFALNSQPHRLLLFKQLTREMAAQEVAIWKKVIRVIAHELNNSLAPISSLAHSGLTLALTPEPERLARVFGTIEERATHLATFIEGYARFAKLPRPRPVAVQWNDLLGGLKDSLSFRVLAPLPAGAAWLDSAQIEQVLINLIKNAAESGSAPEEVTLAVQKRNGGVALEISDRGSGLPPEVLRDALLPFFSTKPKGTGLGLTLCREIVEAHGGRISLANRQGGGAVVSVWLPERGLQ